MIVAAKHVLYWLHGLLAFLVWKLGSVCLPRRTPDVHGDSMRVCVLQINALGDVLMVTPLLRALIDAVGPGRVDVVVREHTAPLVENFQGVGEVIPLARPFRWRDPAGVLAFFRLALKLRKRRYQAVLDASRLLQSAWLTYLSHPGKGVGLRLARQLGPFTLDGLGYLYTDEVAIDPTAHMIRQNLSALVSLGIAPVSERVEFVPVAADHLTARAWVAAHGVNPDQPYAVIHPGAKWPPKRWPADRFRSLAVRLRQAGLAVIVIGDRSDAPVLQNVTEGLAPPLIVSAGDLGVGALGAMIQRARVFIGNDSGPMHIAVAVGTPVIALFGPTVPDRTGPLHARGLAVVKPIECRPCRLYYTRDRCERGHNYCMDLIEVDEVWAGVESVLKQPSLEHSAGRRGG